MSIKRGKAYEFEKLRQDAFMTIMEYGRRFTELSRCASKAVSTKKG